MFFPLIDASTLSDEELQRRLTDIRNKMSQAGAARSTAIPQMTNVYQELMLEYQTRQMARADKQNEEFTKKIDIS